MELPWGFYLGWDWPWFVFFIVLGVSVALASVMKNWQVLWVIPGLVLYSGLFWALPGGWSLLFKLVFWVCLIVAVVTAVLPGRTRLARVPMYLMIGLIIWCLVLWAFSGVGNIPGWDLLWKILLVAFLVGLVLRFFMTKTGSIILAIVVVLAILNLALGLLFGGEPEERSDSPSDACLTIKGTYDPEMQREVPDGYVRDEAKDCTKRKVRTEPEGDEPAACSARFRQELDPNRRFRFESDGFQGTAKEKRRQFVVALGHDYRYLDFVAEQLFSRPIVDASLVTADRRCLSEKGQTLHAKVEGALMASGVRTGLAPRDGYNTGVRNGDAVVAKRRGVYGDRKATIYTLADGTRLIVLDRCGNMVLKSKPKGVPEGPTDNPAPPKEEQPPPHENQPPDDTGGCVEIPGNGVYDCGSKDPSEEPAQQGNVPDQVTGQNPGTGGSPASQPSAQPPDTYTPPPPPVNSGSSGGGGSGDDSPPPPVESSAPQPDNPEPSPTQDPCEVNPDWC